MSSQADVRSIEALKEFRVALALFAEEALGALGAVKMEARRTVQWVQHDRKTYWAEQIKRRREAVASARAEVSRRQLAKTPEHTPAMSEQKELLRKAEAGLREAEAKVVLVKKWEPCSSRPSSNSRPASAGSPTSPAATSPAPCTCSAGWSTPWKPTHGRPRRRCRCSGPARGSSRSPARSSIRPRPNRPARDRTGDSRRSRTGRLIGS